MIDRLAVGLCELADRLLPARHKSWGGAMRAELPYIPKGEPALVYAGGCLVAALKTRARDFDSRFAAGLWTVALISAAFAVIHIRCAARGVSVMLGAHDGFLAALRDSGAADPELVANYHRAVPIVALCLFALGLAHLAAAWFLARAQLHRFLIAWCGALAIAALAVAIQLSVVWTVDGLPSEFFALLVQAIAIPLLLLWSNGRHRHPWRST